jgi:hypothetical protein
MRHGGGALSRGDEAESATSKPVSAAAIIRHNSTRPLTKRQDPAYAGSSLSSER